MEDALVAVEAGADALGFNFYARSPRYIDPNEARKIIECLPSGVLSVGVFVNEHDVDSVSRMADQAGVGAIQLHGDESPDYCRALGGRYVIKALRVDSDFSSGRALEYETQAILLDASSAGLYGGTGQVVDWSVAREVCSLVPRLFLAGGLSAENVVDAVTLVRPFAVDACSRLEVTRGRKDHGLVRAFITSAHSVC